MNEIPILAFISICFIYAAYEDYRTQRVSNRLWLFMLSFAFVSLWIYSPTFFECLGIVLTCMVGYVFWLSNYFGGADVKGILILSFFIPQIYIIPLTLWILLGACVIQIIHSIMKKEFNTPKPFMPPLSVNVVVPFILVSIESFI